MKKIVLVVFGLVITLIILYYFVIVVLIGSLFNVAKEVDEDISVRKELIGEKFVVEKDTLLIIDYSPITGDYSVHGSDATYSATFVDKN